MGSYLIRVVFRDVTSGGTMLPRPHNLLVLEDMIMSHIALTIMLNAWRKHSDWFRRSKDLGRRTGCCSVVTHSVVTHSVVVPLVGLCSSRQSEQVGIQSTE